jgi:Na+-transporting methylmalonyl-CoA/oxaloacetate decarboxylase gamma subunit
MNPTIINALWITLIGMGLVFIALILLWGLMELMVRLTAGWDKREAVEPAEENDASAAPTMGDTDLGVTRRRAAAAAVALALALQPQSNNHRQRSISTPSSSAWQSVLRANQMNQRSMIYSRKQRGNQR